MLAAGAAGPALGAKAGGGAVATGAAGELLPGGANSPAERLKLGGSGN